MKDVFLVYIREQPFDFCEGGLGGGGIHGKKKSRMRSWSKYLKRYRFKNKNSGQKLQRKQISRTNYFILAPTP